MDVVEIYPHAGHAGHGAATTTPFTIRMPIPSVRRPIASVGNTDFYQLAMPTAVHLHGGHVPSSSDGFPTDVLTPGRSRVDNYPNKQRATTLWYHDHAHHTEAEHVFRGLADTLRELLEKES